MKRRNINYLHKMYIRCIYIRCIINCYLILSPFLSFSLSFSLNKVFLLLIYVNMYAFALVWFHLPSFFTHWLDNCIQQWHLVSTYHTNFSLLQPWWTLWLGDLQDADTCDSQHQIHYYSQVIMGPQPDVCICRNSVCHIGSLEVRNIPSRNSSLGSFFY